MPIKLSMPSSSMSGFFATRHSLAIVYPHNLADKRLIEVDGLGQVNVRFSLHQSPV